MTRAAPAGSTRPRALPRIPARAAGPRCACLLLLLFAAAAPAASSARAPVVQPREDYSKHFSDGQDYRDAVRQVLLTVRVEPSPARVGQAIRYRGALLAAQGVRVRFEVPHSDASFTWPRITAPVERPTTVRYSRKNAGNRLS